MWEDKIIQLNIGFIYYNYLFDENTYFVEIILNC